MRDPTISFFCARARACVAALAALASLTGCPMQIPAASQTGYQEFYTCVARVSDLPRFIALSKQPGAPFTEAQVRAYYAQFPIGKTDTDGAPCYAQHWRIPNAVLVGVVEGYTGDLRLSFPLPAEGEATPAGGIDGLGTADVVVGSRLGHAAVMIPYGTSLINPDGSVSFNPATDVLRRDESAGVDLIIQKRCPDVGGRIVDGVSVDRREGFSFSGNIPCGAPEAFASLDGLHMMTDLDGRNSITYYIWPKNLLRFREINAAVKQRIRQFMTNPKTLLPMASESKDH